MTRLSIYTVFTACILSSALSSTTAAAGLGQATVRTNIPQTITAPITLGATGVAIPLPISGCTSLRLEAIVPVNNSSFTVLNPSDQAETPAALFSLHGVFFSAAQYWEGL